MQYNSKQEIVRFIGDKIRRRPDYEDRVKAGKGSYGILLSGGWVLDCYDHKHECLASMANRARGCFDTVTNRMAVPNCYLVVRGDIVSLRCIEHTVIEPSTELCYAYGGSYIMPTI